MAIALATLRADAYSAIRTVIDNNKVAGTSVINSYPEADPTFPCYVLPMQSVEFSAPTTLDGSKRTYTITAEVEVFATRNQGQVKIAQMLDSIMDAFDGSNLTSDNLMFESLSSSEVVKLEVNQEKLYTAGVLLTFTYIR